MDLIGFYDANPTFFADIFALMFLGARLRKSTDEIGANDIGLYLLTGLRASCRVFARIVPRPRRDYLRHVCNHAVAELSAPLCAYLIARNPAFSAKIMFDSISCSVYPLEQLDARDQLICRICNAHSHSHYLPIARRK